MIQPRVTNYVHKEIKIFTYPVYGLQMIGRGFVILSLCRVLVSFPSIFDTCMLFLPLSVQKIFLPSQSTVSPVNSINNTLKYEVCTTFVFVFYHNLMETAIIVQR